MALTTEKSEDFLSYFTSNALVARFAQAVSNLQERRESLGLSNPGSVEKLTVHHVAEEPDAEGGMIANPAVTRRLAHALGRPIGDVRLYFQADQSETFPFMRQPGSGAVPCHRIHLPPIRRRLPVSVSICK